MAEAAAPAPKTARRDALIAIELAMQKKWEEQKVFEVDAPAEGEEAEESFMCTFPYPYMNGMMHLGHAFTLTKVRRRHCRRQPACLPVPRCQCACDCCYPPPARCPAVLPRAPRAAEAAPPPLRAPAVTELLFMTSPPPR